MNSNIILATVCLLLAICVQSGEGVKCYVCNSFYEKDGCQDLDTAKEVFKKDCDEVSESEGKGLKYTHCRKIDQDVFGEQRIVRQCATKGEDGKNHCAKKTGITDITVMYCKCNGDYCNTAPGHMASVANIALLTVISGLVALILHS